MNEDIPHMILLHCSLKVRTSRNASIPYVWSKADIKKLLGAIDRADPKGKRDYAILLIAIRLGLRIGDIRSLKKSSIDWNRKTINLIMSKTGQPIELPLLKRYRLGHHRLSAKRSPRHKQRMPICEA